MPARKLGHYGPKFELSQNYSAIWNDRPEWPYIGKHRFDYLGRPLDARHFSIKMLTPVSVRWTVDMQAWAVSEGFFIQREYGGRERAIIVGVNRFDQTFSYFHPYKTMQEIERRVFRREPRYGVLFDFIKQQDQYGYTGAWDIAIQNYTPDLLWYKMLKRPIHDMKRRKAILQANAKAAREAKDVKRARRMIRGYQ